MNPLNSIPPGVIGIIKHSSYPKGITVMLDDRPDECAKGFIFLSEDGFEKRYEISFKEIRKDWYHSLDKIFIQVTEDYNEFLKTKVGYINDQYFERIDEIIINTKAEDDFNDQCFEEVDIIAKNNSLDWIGDGNGFIMDGDGNKIPVKILQPEHPDWEKTLNTYPNIIDASAYLFLSTLISSPSSGVGTYVKETEMNKGWGMRVMGDEMVKYWEKYYKIMDWMLI